MYDALLTNAQESLGNYDPTINSSLWRKRRGKCECPVVLDGASATNVGAAAGIHRDRASAGRPARNHRSQRLHLAVAEEARRDQQRWQRGNQHQLRADGERR